MLALKTSFPQPFEHSGGTPPIHMSAMPTYEMSNISMHSSIHEDNARTMQGILDSLREIMEVPAGQSLVEAARRMVDAGQGTKQPPVKAGDEISELVRGLTVLANTTLHATVPGSHRARERDLVLQACAILSQSRDHEDSGDVPTQAATTPHDDGWLQSGSLLYRLTDDRHPQNRDEINVMMADGSRTDEARTRRASELLDRIRAHRPVPLAAPVMGIRVGQVSVSALKALFEAIGYARTSSGDVRHESLLVPEALAIVDDAAATSASDDTISVNVLKTRIRNRSCAGAILTQDVISIIDSMEQAKLAGSIG